MEALELSSDLGSTDFQQACQVSSVGQGTVIAEMTMGKQGIHAQKGEGHALHLTGDNNQLHTDQKV